MVEVEALASLVISSFAIISFFYMYFKEISDIKSRVVSLETKIMPFWNWVDRELPKILHSPHTPEFDKLLEKYSDDRENMTIDELKQLVCTLKDEVSKTEKDKILLYALMLGSVNGYINDRISKK